jgi:hypothetical protein
MERPERKILGLLSPLQQIAENQRYIKAEKEYQEWLKIDREKQRLENERLKLENEEKRALVEGLRKQQGLGGSENIYDRVEKQPEPKQEHWFIKLWKS